MPIITLGCSKGGTGKSTIATNLVVALQHQGFNVILVDCDNQFSANDWADERDHNEELTNIMHVQKVGRIKTTLIQFRDMYDYVVVDSGGHDRSSELRQALTICDLVLVPLRPSQLDLNAIPTMIDLIEDARELENENLKALYVLNAVNTAARSTTLKEVKDALKGADNITLCKTSLFNRDAYVRAVGDGKGVIELKNKKAKDEMLALTKEVLSQFETKKYGIRKSETKPKVKKKKSA
ncbi:ParA-like protein (plasmid) [Piscirickettsia salmonis]|uniref:AAA family ATPase n=1 Tax=Piscirickettsia salmonis TaxID=1238 RepID=UPI0012B90181|nr:AAA family ATPase [Piscirickettsia salmonis]QGP52225.1 ParA-like protein [Piscirickettsia salmonis]QGP57347.1 ParA-like protein [Piscirickettsia salmonis]QGP66941.1 ParA-like protein [Piscirickettsia salmonis]